MCTKSTLFRRVRNLQFGVDCRFDSPQRPALKDRIDRNLCTKAMEARQAEAKP